MKEEKNMDKNKTIRFTIATGLILIAALTRLIPHQPNFTPVLGMAVFAAAVLYSKTWMKFVIPLTAMFLTDLFLGIDSVMIFTYGSVGLIIAGSALILRKITFARVLSVSLMAAVVFFAVTNFGCWLMFDMYSHSLAGLATCYQMAIPFFRNTLLSTLISTGVLFGMYYMLENAVNKSLVRQ